MNKIGVAVVGFGTIGSGVVEILQTNRNMINKRVNADVTLLYVVDKDLKTDRGIKVNTAVMTGNYQEALDDPAVNIIVELVGGTGFAYTLIEESLKAGKHVVTANKALLAEKGAPLFKLAREQKLALGFEASVAGGIPIIRTVNDALAGDSIHAIYGIVNGTTNYILTKMLEESWSFETALKKAQELGFAEADPTLDIEGYDAAHKIALLSAIAFNTTLRYDQVYVEGISNIDLQDVQYAGELGYIMKLLAITRKGRDNRIELRVNPTLVSQNNQLATGKNEFNAVMIESRFLGESMYYGKGAGSQPTASAVLADILDIARWDENPSKTNKYLPFNDYSVIEPGEIQSRYYIRFSVLDQAGVLEKISGIFSRHQISISSMIQKERSAHGYVPLIMTTHLSRETDMKKALDEIAELDFNEYRGILIRILES